MNPRQRARLEKIAERAMRRTERVEDRQEFRDRKREIKQDAREARKRARQGDTPDAQGRTLSTVRVAGQPLKQLHQGMPVDWLHDGVRYRMFEGGLMALKPDSDEVVQTFDREDQELPPMVLQALGVLDERLSGKEGARLLRAGDDPADRTQDGLHLDLAPDSIQGDRTPTGAHGASYEEM